MAAEELVHHHQDDQSHYEISLTAGQAFVAFVLLLLSLAASFAFGLMIGKGQADERLIVRKDPEVVTEGAASKKKSEAKIVELGVADDDFAVTEEETPVTDSAVTAVTEPEAEVTTPVTEPALQSQEGAPQPAAAAPAPAPVKTAEPAAPAIPHYAQLLSTGDQKTAEGLAAKLIDRGFMTAYVERGANDKGPIYRVRVRFPSEADARAAEPKLKEFSKEVWITK